MQRDCTQMPFMVFWILCLKFWRRKSRNIWQWLLMFMHRLSATKCMRLTRERESLCRRNCGSRCPSWRKSWRPCILPLWSRRDWKQMTFLERWPKKQSRPDWKYHWSPVTEICCRLPRIISRSGFRRRSRAERRSRIIMPQMYWLPIRWLRYSLSNWKPWWEIPPIIFQECRRWGRKPHRHWWWSTVLWIIFMPMWKKSRKKVSGNPWSSIRIWQIWARRWQRSRPTANCSWITNRPEQRGSIPRKPIPCANVWNSKICWEDLKKMPPPMTARSQKASDRLKIKKNFYNIWKKRRNRRRSACGWSRNQWMLLRKKKNCWGWHCLCPMRRRYFMPWHMKRNRKGS